MENRAQDSELAEEGQCEVPEKEQIKVLETDSTGRAEKGLGDNDKRVDDRTEGSRNGAGRDGPPTRPRTMIRRADNNVYTFG